MNTLEKFGNIPVDFNALSNALKKYSYPADKLSALEKAGEIYRLKKGLYVVSEQISGKKISRELIANHLYGPSYISCETALSYYGLIPERVYTFRSLTTRRSRIISNKFGHYEYITTPSDYFYLGIRQIVMEGSYAFIMATPEKALCDLITTTRMLRIQSVKAMSVYLEDDLRFEMTELEKFDRSIIEQCLKYGKKKTELKNLLKLLRI
ncbi:MAG: type IV toxin-antitoxin system AbiEi family antitoxin domain-containing protein [Bacteroidota bacterium]